MRHEDRGRVGSQRETGTGRMEEAKDVGASRSWKRQETGSPLERLGGRRHLRVSPGRRIRTSDLQSCEIPQQQGLTRVGQVGREDSGCRGAGGAAVRVQGRGELRVACAGAGGHMGPETGAPLRQAATLVFPLQVTQS